MNKLISLILVVISTAACANTRLGLFSLTDIRNSEDNVAIGKYAGSGITESSNNTLVGDGAGLAATNINDSIGIGSDALLGARNLRGTVAIGNGELAGVGGLNDTTSINRQQIFVSKPANAFAINPLQKENITETPLYYLNGELHINAPIVSEGVINSSAGGESFDMYLSPDGNDANHGRSPMQAKKTIDGIYAAATNDMRIGVLPGDYLPPSNNEPNGYKWLISTPHSLEFVAIEGKSKTSITGAYENDNVWSNGFHHTLAFEAGPQTFRGFTLRNLSGWILAKSSNTQNQAPIASCAAFIDCAFENDILRSHFSFSGFNSCSFENTTITANRWEYFASMGGNAGALFAGCTMVNCAVKIADVENLIFDEYYGCYRFFDEGQYSRSLFNLPPFKEQYERSQRNTASFSSCTFIYDVVLNNDYRRVYGSKSTDCYFCAGEDEVPHGGVGNAFAASWTNTYLNAEYVPASIECPAVRDDGRKDAGWRDSGLGCQKAFASRANIRIEDGALVVYQGGTAIGTIPMDAIATTLRMPRPENEENTIQESEKDGAESVIILSPKK